MKKLTLLFALLCAAPSWGMDISGPHLTPGSATTTKLGDSAVTSVKIDPNLIRFSNDCPAETTGNLIGGQCWETDNASETVYHATATATLGAWALFRTSAETAFAEINISTDNAETTTLASNDVFVEIAGVYETEALHEFSESTDGQLQYDGPGSKDFFVDGHAECVKTGGGATVGYVRIGINGDWTTTSAGRQQTRATLPNTSAIITFPITVHVTLLSGDYISAGVATTDSDDMTCTLNIIIAEE